MISFLVFLNIRCIHTFDLIASNKRKGDFKIALQPYSTFHHWGLGTKEQSDESKKTGNRRRRQFKTLQETMKELGHVGRRIDLFKIDCKGCEWTTYDRYHPAIMIMILI